jgi:ABC-type antimicrobial peptide transport system permease subunit
VADGLKLALLGLGTVISLGAGRLLSGLLFGVSPRDPVTFVSVAGVVVLAAAAASFVPARRAARVDPLIAIRTE